MIQVMYDRRHPLQLCHALFSLSRSGIDDGGLQRAAGFETTELTYDFYDSCIYFNEKQFAVHTLLDE